MPIWIPPAERRRFKGLDMAHKTKATMPGRQCSTENREQASGAVKSQHADIKAKLKFEFGCSG